MLACFLCSHCVASSRSCNVRRVFGLLQVLPAWILKYSNNTELNVLLCVDGQCCTVVELKKILPKCYI